ncbi:hypothetical protein ACLOJK_003046 [Asimina triloba]
MDFRKSIRQQTDFSLHVAAHLLSKHSSPADGANLVFSPSSIHVALSMVAAGAAGRTLEQTVSFLRSESKDDLNAFSSQLIALIFADGAHLGAPRMAFAAGVWVEKALTLKASFKETLEKGYGSEAQMVDFQTQSAQVANEINSWAENKTSGLIKELLPGGSVNSLTRLVLANALYFKGTWSEKFDASMTKDFDFHLLDGNTVKAPFMTCKKKQFISSCDGFKVLTLPYRQGEDKRQFSMYFFLPDAKDGLPSLIQKMGSDSGFIDRHLPIQQVEVREFLIPRFKISFAFEASEHLKELGLVSPFSAEADLSEMVDSPVGQNLVVSSIHHKSFIEVNEEGTEAAAATAAVVMLRSLAMDEPIDFVADHPFAFLIRENMTGVALFIGHVLNPLLSD